MITAKYDGETFTELKWYRQNLAISPSGNKSWKGGNSSAVKVPGTGEDVIPGDLFQWAAHENYALPVNDFGNGKTDRGLLIYDSFTSKGCGDASDAFEFKSFEAGKKYYFGADDHDDIIGISPYYNKLDTKYTAYNPDIDSKVTLESTDDVANIILGSWRMPTSAEFKAMRDATYWAWDETDEGYYVFIPGQGTSGSAGGRGAISGTDDKTKALLFFPATGRVSDTSLNYAGSNGFYWSGSLYSSSPSNAYHLYFISSTVNPQSYYYRYYGFPVRPVSD